MKKFIFIFLLIACTFTLKAQVNNSFSKVQTQAKNENKLILIKFSGSDWCAPCIAMKNNIFDNLEFKNFAKKELIIFTADFPRQKKNQLPKERQEENNLLAEKYNPNGYFPYLLLIDADGNILKTWNGYNKKISVDGYIKEISTFIK